MSELRWEIIKHSNITESLLIEIAKIKDQHWTHGISSQLQWIKDNIRDEDYHLCGFYGQILTAYMAIVEVKVVIDSKEIIFLGLSNVCVNKDYGKRGYGSELVQQANSFISDQNRMGLLLCKESLVIFYQKNLWSLVKYQNAMIQEESYDKEIMVYSRSKLENIDSIQIERNF